MRVLALVGLSVLFVVCLGLILLEVAATWSALNGDPHTLLPWPLYLYGAVFYVFMACAVAAAIRRTAA